MKPYLILALVVVLLLAGFLFLLNRNPGAPAPELPEGETLRVHFLDVGQADCILVESRGEYLLIDGGNVGDGQLVVSYLLEQGVQDLEAVVCTHAHEDHVGGLSSVLAVFPTEQVLAPTATYSSGCFDDFARYTNQQGLNIQIPAPGDTLQLGSAEITVLGPVKSYPETNNTSLVLRLTFGWNAFLFTGDMETDAEEDLLARWDDVSADVLKVGHHGSETSTGYRFLYEVDPDYAVISVGAGNKYGHPDAAPLSRLRDANLTLFRTDRLGTVVATSDGSEISFTWEKQSAAPEYTEAQEQVYTGNKKSRKFHIGGCPSLPKEENRVLFSSWQEAIDAGYTPCTSCLK